ncbi:DsbE family thiol:disulfide interchange protein [Roseiterribacter gracilis]|uniref:Thiol:disulfide interchange protein n=1 Tax=Roseiterribacter gracilis TaxID=2812848 RepID=A0A8S8XCN1_9PROT|nr:thiol:disulfide interchange protein [Rhodospirillales bacterium TMPK1]
MRRLLYLLPALLLAVLLFRFVTPLLRGDDPSRIASVLIGKPVPNFALASLDGTPGPSSDKHILSSASLRGQITLVNFFASWCTPCRAEHPTLMRVAASKKAVVIGIAYKDDPMASAKFLAELGNPFAQVGVDRAGATGIEFGLTGVPETFVIDAKGIVRFRHVGPLLERDVADKILPLLAKLKNEQ